MRTHWVLSVPNGGVRIEVTNAACPSDKEIGAALCRLATGKSNRMRVVTSCIVAKDTTRLKSFAARWEKRGFNNKTEVMIKAYSEISRLNPQDHNAFVRMARYRLKRQIKPFIRLKETKGGFRWSKRSVLSNTTPIPNVTLKRYTSRRTYKLKSCYERRLKSNRELRGKLLVGITIKPGGRVCGAKHPAKAHP